MSGFGGMNLPDLGTGAGPRFWNTPDLFVLASPRWSREPDRAPCIMTRIVPPAMRKAMV